VALETDEFELVWLVCEFRAGLLLGDDTTHEPLAGLDDPLHGFVDGLEVLRGQRGLHIEVIVKTVGNRRPDPELRLRVDRLQGLCRHVGGRVAQDTETIRRGEQHRLRSLTDRDRCRKIPQFSPNSHGDDLTVGEKLEPGGLLRRRDRLENGLGAGGRI
jgi:hypothetical protein